MIKVHIIVKIEQQTLTVSTQSSDRGVLPIPLVIESSSCKTRDQPLWAGVMIAITVFDICVLVIYCKTTK